MLLFFTGREALAVGQGLTWVHTLLTLQRSLSSLNLKTDRWFTLKNHMCSGAVGSPLLIWASTDLKEGHVNSTGVHVWLLYLDWGQVEVAQWPFQTIHRVSVWMWPRFLWGRTYRVTTYCGVCGYRPSVYAYVHMHMRTIVLPGYLGFTTVPVIFSEAMTSAEKWAAFQKGRPIIVGCFYWSKRVLKIRTIVFLWWSRSTLVFFVFCRSDSSGGHRVLVLSLDGRKKGRPGLWFYCGRSCF